MIRHGSLLLILAIIWNTNCDEGNAENDPTAPKCAAIVSELSEKLYVNIDSKLQGKLDLTQGKYKAAMMRKAGIRFVANYITVEANCIANVYKGKKLLLRKVTEGKKVVQGLGMNSITCECFKEEKFRGSKRDIFNAESFDGQKIRSQGGCAPPCYYLFRFEEEVPKFEYKVKEIQIQKGYYVKGFSEREKKPNQKPLFEHTAGEGTRTYTINATAGSEEGLAMLEIIAEEPGRKWSGDPNVFMKLFLFNSRILNLPTTACPDGGCYLTYILAEQAPQAQYQTAAVAVRNGYGAKGFSNEDPTPDEKPLFEHRAGDDSELYVLEVGPGSEQGLARIDVEVPLRKGVKWSLPDGVFASILAYDTRSAQIPGDCSANLCTLNLAQMLDEELVSQLYRVVIAKGFDAKGFANAEKTEDEKPLFVHKATEETKAYFKKKPRAEPGWVARLEYSKPPKA